MAIARQIVDALDTAHERGIVHRDLKPANIKVTSDGLVKVLDFGLAKAMDAAASGSQAAQNLSYSPTMAVGATHTGAILGTASYMSPEQARGKAVDRRTDIWAFGCVLYEMLTCRVAFPGETLSDVLVSILDRVPDWSAVPSGAPPTVMRLVRRCLEKEARKRLRDIGDARLDLEDAFSAAEGAVAADTSRLPVRHVEFQRLTDVEGLKEAPAVSPDGKMVAFVAMVAGKRQIWIRLLAGGAVLQLTRDDADHMHPRWAPDSSTLIYFTPAATESDAGTVWEIGALGGWPRRIATAIGAADISHDGQRIAMLQSSEDQLALVVASRDGSAREPCRVLAHRVVHRTCVGRRMTVRLPINDWPMAASMVTSRWPAWRPANGTRCARGTWLQGFAWLPDGSGFVYSSSGGARCCIPPSSIFEPCFATAAATDN